MQKMLQKELEYKKKIYAEFLKQKAKYQNLRNLFFPDNVFGAGFSNVKYAPVAEMTGQS